ncbi:hypothetical protein BCUN_1580 [Bifidobacterium cuniculi]|uniref:Uncharacterized protein n=1 Tax=Bifidobacterium cuniculi TaxID=1688 RepID=A0A087AM13_9BIFI|nr:hypothetical protein BCUN_1580 [Bifidobacterium cuniculi]
MTNGFALAGTAIDATSEFRVGVSSRPARRSVADRRHAPDGREPAGAWRERASPAMRAGHIFRRCTVGSLSVNIAVPHRSRAHNGGTDRAEIRCGERESRRAPVGR